MAVRQTLQIGDPRLKQKNLIIRSGKDKVLAEEIKDLIDTMIDTGIIGIAGPQIGINKRIFITEPRETDTRPKDQSDILRVYINPQIKYFSYEKTIIYEGCGSVNNGNLFGPVLRPKIIIIQALDIEGKKFELECDGILARVIQHEFDHLEGIEFTEKIYDYSKLMNRENYILYAKNSKENIANSKITSIKSHSI